MAGRRTARLKAERRHRRMWVIPLIVAAVVVVGAMAAGLLLGGGRGPGSGPVTVAAEENPLPDRSIESSDGASGAKGAALSSASVASVIEVEVPDVVGKDLDTAEMIMEAAGFHVVTRIDDTPAPGLAANSVVTQSPQSGTRLDPKQPVTLVYQPKQTVSNAPGQHAVVVVIDPGHQLRADGRPEPIGPGSSVTKARVAGGATGIRTGIPECRDTLQIALKLRDVLQRSGVKVIMTRTVNDVDVSNKQRAEIGNKAKAALVLRIHCDGSTSHAVNGLSTLYPAGNQWVGPITQASRRAALLLQAAAVAASGAHSRGLFGRSDQTGFNWSSRPTVTVECGFLSNPDEDRRLATDAYQKKLAAGLARGVLTYLGR